MKVNVAYLNMTGFLGMLMFFNSVKAQDFSNMANAAGLNVNLNSPMDWGSGVSFYDFDNDGWDDLTFGMEDAAILFYKNVNGQFVQLPTVVPVMGKVNQVLWADIDNDGDQDFFVTIIDQPYKLYRNNGNFTFADISMQAGLFQTNRRSYGASFGDYNHDGYLDLYVCNYEFFGDTTLVDRYNQLYKNNGNGTFTNVTLQAGVGNGIKASFQSVWFDYNLDGLLDLYVINDRIFWANALYQNNGDGTFTDVTLISGSDLLGNCPMSNSIADFDNDGDFDIYVSNSGPGTTTGKLLVNNGNGTFTESAQLYGVAIDKLSWGCVWFDADNDTRQDLFVCTASAEGLPQVVNYFYKNTGSIPFVLQNNIFQNNQAVRSYSAARGDFNNDGKYDLVVHNNIPSNAFLWQNSGGTNHYIKCTLRGTVSNRDAVGSLIHVYAGGQVFTHMTICGENYIGQSSQHYILGLGQSVSADSIVVTYPSGHKDFYYDLPADSHYYFTEGETYFAHIQALGPLIFCEGEQVELNGGMHSAYYWSNGSSSPQISVNQSGLVYLQVQNQYGILSQPDSVQLMMHSLPDAVADYVQPSCSGYSDGEINISLHPEVLIPYEIVWNTGVTGSLINNITEGFYHFVYSDLAGCTFSQTHELIEPPPIVVLWETTPAQPQQPGLVSLIINGGTPPYTVLFDSDTVLTTDISYTQPGTGLLKIIDNNHCEHSQMLELPGFGFGIHTNSDSYFTVFPNPVSDFKVYIDWIGNTENVVIRLTDIMGKTVYHDEQNTFQPELNAIQLPESLNQGIYFIIIETESLRSVSKILLKEK